MATATHHTVDKLTDLPAVLREAGGFAELLAALHAGRSGAVDGAWGSSAALTAAALSVGGPPCLVVVLAHPGEVGFWAEDLATFTGARPAVFPAAEERVGERLLFDNSTGQRLRALRQLQTQPPGVLLTTAGALLQPVPTREEAERNSRTLTTGGQLDPDEFARWLVERGYKRVEAVELPGEFSRRGGILDVFPPDAGDPYRVELFGDEIESLRQFSAQTQRSLGASDTVRVGGVSNPEPEGPSGRGHLCDYLPAGSWVVLCEPEELVDAGKQFLERAGDAVGLFSVDGSMRQLLRFVSVTLRELPAPTVETVCHLRVESVERFSGNVATVRDELDSVARRENVLVACGSDAECKRLTDVLAAGKLAQDHRLRLLTGHVRSGFRLVEAGVMVLGSHELFHREAVAGRPAGADAATPGLPRRRVESRALDSFLELQDGDYVVHVSHGIAIFRGMSMLPRQSREAQPADGEAPALEEHLSLEFRDGVTMYVPASKIDLVQKYVGGTNASPELSKLGGTTWQNRKDKVESAVMDMAAEMLELQAVRAAQPGTALPVDSEWQEQFEAAFPYQETPDQLAALAEIRKDMQSTRPMDRLICGDVGYGKTELAIRAAFKAVDNGKQVAVLVPTTVLAEQHYRTFSSRFAEYPFVVECLSRFRSAGHQKRILKEVATGGVDVVIGTHRLLSQDVRFRELGLVIVDEEQRFGVEHKERLKRLRALVDILTLTATPIPRTLHLALLGIRDISNLETPPAERLPVETRITRYDEQLIRHAVLRELNREGQVYFVHNRVYDIRAVADRLQKMVPEASIVVGHGQMGEGELEAAMLRFVRREADILVATTIIESGLDIPTANTMFIDDADTYGLADLHQLRGRVGRHKNRAYAYLLLHPNKPVSGVAAKRLKAIEEFSELGAGFKIAMRDLEIRGAGNILGNQQSGHIAAVGYEMYCQLLENAVRTLKKMPLKTPLEATVDLPWPAFLPKDYVSGQKLRIEVYRRLARVRDLKTLDDFAKELRDRYGPPPESAEWLLRTTELRIRAAAWQVDSVHRHGPDVVLGYRDRQAVEALAKRSKGRLRVVDDKSAYYRLRDGEEVAEALYKSLRHLLREAESVGVVRPARG